MFSHSSRPEQFSKQNMSIPNLGMEKEYFFKVPKYRTLPFVALSEYMNFNKHY